MSGEANFSIPRTALTVGGFTQPQVAKALIEQPPDKGLAQRFLWIIPCPTYSNFEALEAPDEDFIQYMSMQWLWIYNMIFVYTCDVHKGVLAYV